MAVPTAESIYKQISGLEGQLGGMESFLPRAGSDIRQEIGRLTDYGAPVMKDVARIQEQAYGALPQAMETFQATPETERVSALSALGGAIGGFGKQLGLRDMFSGIATRQGQRLEDIIGQATEAYKAPYELATERIGRLTPLFQTQTQVEEGAREREFTAEQRVLQQRYETLESAKERAFATGEREAGQRFQAEQDRITRDFNAIENEKSRASSRAIASGSQLNIQGMLDEFAKLYGTPGGGDVWGDTPAPAQGIDPEMARFRHSQLQQSVAGQRQRQEGGASPTWGVSRSPYSPPLTKSPMRSWSSLTPWK